jgi:hypothetical protein
MNISSELNVVLHLEVFIRCYMIATLVGYGVVKAPPSEVCSFLRRSDPGRGARTKGA